MAIVKWQVDRYGSNPVRREYDRQTKNFYIKASGGRDSIICHYYCYFDSDVEALEYIRQRAEDKADQKRVEQINRCGIELLAALESTISDLFYQIESRHGAEAASNYPSVVEGRAAIAKAKGLA